MNVVDRRNRVWNRVSPIMSILFQMTKLMSIEHAKKRFERIRFKTGWINMAWRYILLKRIGTKFIGEGYRIIQPNVCIYNADKLTMGERVTINDNSYLECSGEIEIGNDVMIGHGVSILSNSHNFNEINVPMNRQGESFGKIKIGNNVWIGAKVTILHGVTIGDGAIIGAHSLVNKNVLQNNVVAGIPARHIKTRCSNMEDTE